MPLILVKKKHLIAPLLRFWGRRWDPTASRCHRRGSARVEPVLSLECVCGCAQRCWMRSDEGGINTCEMLANKSFIYSNTTFRTIHSVLAFTTLSSQLLDNFCRITTDCHRLSLNTSINYWPLVTNSDRRQLSDSSLRHWVLRPTRLATCLNNLDTSNTSDSSDTKSSVMTQLSSIKILVLGAKCVGKSGKFFMRFAFFSNS